AGTVVPPALDDITATCKAAGFDLVIVETPGIGQGDAAITEHVDVSLYVMTPEYGAASQLEKIDMLDFADVVAINKFERRGAEDARRDVARQMLRNREAFGQPWESMPVFGTSAARFDDDGVTALYQELRRILARHGLPEQPGVLPRVETKVSTGLTSIIPLGRERYLSEIAEVVRAYHATTAEQAQLVRRRAQLLAARDELAGDADPELLEALERRAKALSERIAPDVEAALAEWPTIVEAYSGDAYTYRVRDREIRVRLHHETPAGTKVPRVALPRVGDPGELVRFLREENLPGRFPFTAGVFPFKREEEPPTRMFAGEGDPFRTNRRFHYLARGSQAARLSTA